MSPSTLVAIIIPISAFLLLLIGAFLLIAELKKRHRTLFGQVREPRGGGEGS